jgi:replicative DNA helicase
MARVAEDTARRTRPEKVPPHNLEAEESVLGSMMLSREAIAEAIEVVKPDDFYKGSHQAIFEALQHLYGRGDPVDEITAVEELKRRGQLVDVGGPLRIHELVEGVPTPAGASYYAQIVSENALLRRLLRAASEIMGRAYEVPDDPTLFAEEAEGLIYAASRRDQRNDLTVLEPLINESIDDIEKIQYRESSYSGLPTGFRDVDEKLSGLQAGNMVILAARPGLGKSSLALNIARNVAAGDHRDQRKPVAFFSLEMSRWEV